MCLLSSITLAVALSKAPRSFSVLAKYPLPGAGGWDYLTCDAAANRLYISRGSRVQVMNTSNGVIVGEIPNTAGVHGIALDPALREGYVSCGRDNTVVVFNLDTLATKEVVKVGQNPDAILFDPNSKRVFTFNGRSSDATVLDAKSHKVLGTIPLGGKPEFAQSDLAGKVYVNIEDTSEMKEIDAKAMTVTRKWSLAPGEEPSGLAIDVRHKRLFSVCSNLKMAVSDFKSGKVIATPEIGGGPDAAGFDPDWNLAFSSNGQDGTLTVVEVSGAAKPVQTLTTMKSARTLAYDPSHHRGYLIAAEFEAPAPGERRGKMKPGSAAILVFGAKK